MHDDEVDIDEELVGALVAAQFPQWAVLPIRPVEPQGTDNALYRLGDELVARLPRHAPTVALLVKEVEWLPRLAPQLPVAIPLPVAAGVPGEGFPFPWAVYRWLDGEPAADARVNGTSLAAGLADFVAALQRLEARAGPAPGAHNFLRGQPLADRDAPTRRALAALRRDLDVEALAAVWDAGLGAPVWAGAPVWIHGDLDARNVLVSDGRLAAVIDFGCLGIGDPAYDVAAAWRLLDERGRDLFRERLDIDDATWARARGLVVSQAMLALEYYTADTNASLVREARRWLDATTPPARRAGP